MATSRLEHRLLANVAKASSDFDLLECADDWRTRYDGCRRIALTVTRISGSD